NGGGSGTLSGGGFGPHGCRGSLPRSSEGLGLRALRELGATVVVGVLTDDAHREVWGAGPVDPLERRLTKAREHADRVVALATVDPPRVAQGVLQGWTGPGPWSEAGERAGAGAGQGLGLGH
ncbi:unnamed protein product, partial [Discosporangium mesarthrocarpum]